MKKTRYMLDKDRTQTYSPYRAASPERCCAMIAVK